ncbi:MAG: chromosome segregation protein SMC [Vicinamibacterales bacterium]
MRLSRLHIAGFKSFPDRAELGFDQGVTAIVGPNGCGKSNVVDAITWVLGEQSAKSLRGERMEDVIFNGSDARKPTAAAEVRLKLSEVAQAAMTLATAAPMMPPADALLDEQPLVTKDVEIGRRLYRSGESEYLIDGEVCRLRDIHDLLMDSGLGVKAYAVIEQGKIGQILSSRPGERRALIEEAAGVTKYKSRRRAAELKLEAAQGNLTRIDDIIFEVEKQRGALRRQAARARRYKRLREELRRWEQVQFARRYDALARDIDAAEARLEDARAREAAAAGRVAELETALEAVRLGLTGAESGATEAREAAHARELDIGRRQQQIEFDKQQIDDLGRQAEALAAEIRDLEGRRDPARLAIDAQRQAADRARRALEAAGGEVAAREADYQQALAVVQAAEREGDETRAAALAATTTLSALRQARENAEAVRDRVAAERARLDVEARDLEGEGARARDERDHAASQLAAAQAALAAAGEARAKAETTLAQQRAGRALLTNALASRQRDLAGHEAHLESLERLDASRATFGDGARFLLAEAGDAIRQHGAVADYLQVERSYERAVDALIGDLLQHVIVDTASDVTGALALATERGAGRCGFVVIDELANRKAPPVIDVPAAARSLSSVVTATGPYAAILSRLVGEALIVRSFDVAGVLARSVPVPVATVAGEVFRGEGIVEGGSRRDARGILETRGEVKRLREQVAAAAAEIERMTLEASNLDAAIAASDAAMAAASDAQHQHEKAIVGHEAQVARGDEELARASRRLDVVRTERSRAEQEEQAAERRRDDATSAIAMHENAQRGAEGKLGDVVARLKSARDVAEAKTRDVTEARAAQAGLIERTSALDTDVVRLDDAARDLEARIAGRAEDTARNAARREELRRSIHQTEALLDEDVRVLDTLKREMRVLDERVSALRADFGVREHDIRDARHALEGVRSLLMQSEVARATAASDLAHLTSACLEAVGQPIEEVVAAVASMEEAGELVAPARRVAAVAAPDEDEEDVPAAEAGAEGATGDVAEPPSPIDEDDSRALSPEDVIADLRRKIEKLGPVNMMAIEQFDELETRHTFLTTQRKDLLDSIAQTGEAIRKIDKTTRERFAEAFESINKYFEVTFTTLFGGGRAGLVLIDLENDPESGIDIIAQPPGKRLQNVQLLSGGEKALTAMALMFAIFKYRPSPFCLLDEIDAPLDDANIGRFVEMLQGMQDHTQFILITHNRKTMEIADRLYGVTMEEPGVSKLISLQLN